VRLGAPGGVAVYALGRYHGPVRSAVLAYKERGRRDLAAPLGAALAGGLRRLTAAGEPVWLVPLPSRRAAARRRGGDHVLRLAARAAPTLAAAGIPVAVAPALRLARGARDSVGLDAAARVANLAGRMVPRAAGLPPPGTRVVLLDDVATTGATVAAGSAALAAAGVEVAAALVLASAAPFARSGEYRDPTVTLCRGGRPTGSQRA
jgi:predicted amidophosphoribosyltransferase